ncbi:MULTISPECIES: site-specific integrase [unclassified Breznakia]|uniref:site-specific integrase n=1 Tax=unclassified Breznakia TaxID=2623764 RepID=UPI0024749DBA|nr:MULTISPECIES: site-specific integrase [unclassified Breznakia]MDH6367038.1 integrase [Breznakia sp. PH1-1]MDH6404190.1 integrase [Breznakia sp. PF1-11]MDH6411925.1 integrase [Breznakia sp. PFB1-11]MDH6414178.1 integrase [Breznakia sp. PFB1-14]MDH6415999.1 integrase [Breznakia sp. PFB1-4]
MSVYLDRQRKSWYFITRNSNGKQTTRRGFRTRKDAQLAERDFISALETQDRWDYATFDTVANLYIDDLDFNSGSSSYTAESLYRLHVKDIIGDKDIDAVSMNDIKKVQVEMLTKRKADGKHYTYKTINHVTSLVKSILNYALKYEYVEKNRCMGFENLKITKDSFSIKFWTDEQFLKAIQYELDFQWYCMLSILYLTGMRKGEVRGLQWRDINFNDGTIIINRHVNDKIKKESRKSDEEQRVITGRKNGGMHVVAMDMNTKSLLQKQYEHESKKSHYRDSYYVFGGEKPIGQNTLKRHLDKIADLANEPRITVHGLRHSHVSYLISKGLNAYEIANRIGDTVEMVLNVYGHQFPVPQQNIVAVMNENLKFIEF